MALTLTYRTFMRVRKITKKTSINVTITRQKLDELVIILAHETPEIETMSLSEKIDFIVFQLNNNEVSRQHDKQQAQLKNL